MKLYFFFVFTLIVFFSFFFLNPWWVSIWVCFDFNEEQFPMFSIIKRFFLII